MIIGDIGFTSPAFICQAWSRRRMSFLWEKSETWRWVVRKTRDSKPFFFAFATVCGVVPGVIGYCVMQATNSRNEQLEARLRQNARPESLVCPFLSSNAPFFVSILLDRFSIEFLQLRIFCSVWNSGLLRPIVFNFNILLCRDSYDLFLVWNFPIFRRKTWGVSLFAWADCFIDLLFLIRPLISTVLTFRRNFGI